MVKVFFLTGVVETSQNGVKTLSAIMQLKKTQLKRVLIL